MKYTNVNYNNLSSPKADWLQTKLFKNNYLMDKAQPVLLLLLSKQNHKWLIPKDCIKLT